VELVARPRPTAAGRGGLQEPCGAPPRILVADAEAALAALICETLAAEGHTAVAAHDAKDETGKPLDIVHRDVSPQNIIVGADGIARVIDFGIAKAVTSEEMTTAGTIKGKVPYLSPEQLDPDPFMQLLDVSGMPWHIRDEQTGVIDPEYIWIEEPLAA